MRPSRLRSRTMSRKPLSSISRSMDCRPRWAALRSLVAQSGLTQKEFSQKIGIKFTTFNAILVGDIGLTPLHLEAINQRLPEVLPEGHRLEKPLASFPGDPARLEAKRQYKQPTTAPSGRPDSPGVVFRNIVDAE